MADFSSLLSAASALLFGAFETLFAAFALAAGLIALFFGRRFFWIFLGIVGFLAGIVLSGRFVASFEPWLQTVLGLSIAVALALLALGIQRVLAVIAGAAAFGLAAWAFLTGNPAWQQISATVPAAILGGLLMFLYFDWTLILVSVVVGAGVGLVGVSGLLEIPDNMGLWLFLIMLAAGIWYQWNDLRRLAAAPATTPATTPAPAPELRPLPGSTVGPQLQPLPPPSAAARVRTS